MSAFSIIYGERYKGMPLEPGDALLSHALKSRGHEVAEQSAEEPAQDSGRIWLNRVFSSVANDNPCAVESALSLCSALEERGERVINSTSAARADYDKFHQHDLLNKSVCCPDTILLENINQLLDFSGRHDRIVVKPRVGGRGHGVRCLSAADIRSGKALVPLNKSFIAQELVRSILPYDIRVCVYAQKIVYSHGRTLISTDATPECWLGSINRGSKFMEYRPSDQVVFAALQATRSVGAVVNEVDIVLTEKGPVVIEVNCTPNYGVETKELIEHFCNAVEFEMEIGSVN